MSSPTPPDPQGSGSQSTGKATVKSKVGDVVKFTREDPILRRDHQGVGVVVTVDDQALEVRPLTHHTVRVDPANVTSLTASDVA